MCRCRPQRQTYGDQLHFALLSGTGPARGRGWVYVAVGGRSAMSLTSATSVAGCTVLESAEHHTTRNVMCRQPIALYPTEDHAHPAKRFRDRRAEEVFLAQYFQRHR